MRHFVLISAYIPFFEGFSCHFVLKEAKETTGILFATPLVNRETNPGQITKQKIVLTIKTGGQNDDANK
jgi:hypothetical protein